MCTALPSAVEHRSIGVLAWQLPWRLTHGLRQLRWQHPTVAQRFTWVHCVQLHTNAYNTYFTLDRDVPQRCIEIRCIWVHLVKFWAAGAKALITNDKAWSGLIPLFLVLFLVKLLARKKNKMQAAGSYKYLHWLRSIQAICCVHGFPEKVSKQ